MKLVLLNIIVIGVGLLAAAFVILLLHKKGEAADHKHKRLEYIADNKKNKIFQELELSFYQRLVAPKLEKFFALIVDAIPFLSVDETKNAETERLLKLAGSRKSIAEYNAIKVMTFFITIIVTAVVAVAVADINGLLAFLVIAMGLMIAILGPKTVLQSRARNRQETIRNQLPDVIDLLSVSIEAGLSFDAGVRKIVEKMEGPLVDEMNIMNRELAMGRPRKDALKAFGSCCDIDELRTFTSAVIQADQMGIPIKNVLSVQSKQLRLARKQRAQEAGAKAPVKMLIPVLLFIFPGLFIIILGPTVVSVLDTLGS